ncbi:hypothetical protein [Streptomyces sp. NPDC046939]
MVLRKGRAETDAFDVLCRPSQEHNVKPREAARQVCERGSLKDDP